MFVFTKAIACTVDHTRWVGKAHFKFGFGCGNIMWGQLYTILSIGNIGLISPDFFMYAVWIPVCVHIKGLVPAIIFHHQKIH